MIGRKLIVYYDPAHPDRWLIRDEMIEGCKVEQKMGPHLVGLYPNDAGDGAILKTGLNE
jgi:hypothetical protein